MVDEVHGPEDQHPLRRLHNKIQGRPTQVSQRRLMRRHSNGQLGQVSAEDVQNDMEYLAQVSIGTPGQTMNLDFDTGSADL